MTSEKKPDGRGSKPKFDYTVEDAVDLAKKRTTVALLFPGVYDYLEDMARVANQASCGAASLYNRFRGGIPEIMELSGLPPSGINRIALIPEENCPDFVLPKVVEAVGRKALFAYLIETSDAEEIASLRQRLDEM